ncbi:HlyD family efflux transporter periplasmic adaptor subunit [Phytohabitans flavus]|uniref:RND transporter n=1 Tax=Phytohabitans flavus TaxID=1076124 RepID=A0A6F8Y4P0_9ACTN|nr:HlyD family efflux transporter periplasmic adaptor subunit [Phytohabitans flavus]BCB80948.1 RND transporter [Phytohabitans flavus]
MRRSLPRLGLSPALLVNVVLALAVAGAATWAYTSFASAEAAETGGGSSRTVPVTQGTVTATVSASGTVQSASTASASFETSGTVTEIHVQVGDKVTKGQVLAKVDDKAAQRQLDAAEANLDAAQAALDRAEEADSDTSEAEAQVDQAELDVSEAEDGVAGTTLKAPMAGTVTAVSGTVGSSASGSGSSDGGSGPGGGSSGGSDSDSSSSGFIQIEDLTRLEVSASVAEADATKLKTGQAGTVTWNALPGAEAAAKLAAVDPNATSENNVVTYGVTFTLDELPDGVRAGQSVEVSVTVGQADNVVYVNSAALTSVGNRHTVTVLEGGQQVVRAVEIGLEGDSSTEIKSGLTVGEQVVINMPTTSSNQGPFPGGGFPGGGFPGGGGAPGGGARPGGGR